MKKLLLCNFFFIKRCFKKISFLILLFSIPILCIIFKNFSANSSSTIKSGIYIEQDSTEAQNLVQNLLTNYESIDFEICNDIDTLEKKVANNTYEAGYVISKDFEEKINTLNLNNLITVYTSPSSLCYTITNEYVFSEIFKMYAIKELSAYIKNDEVFENDDMSGLDTQLIPIYEEYLSRDSTFSFEYITSDNSTTANLNLFNSYLLMSVKGIIALLIMFISFLGTLNLYKDDRTGIFFSFNGLFKTLGKMSEIFSVTILASFVGLITIYMCELSEGFLIEALRLIVYSLICTLYCYMMYKLIANQYIFTSLIPILILGSIIFCPIFIDFSELIPLVKYISWIFAPKYYFII